MTKKTKEELALEAYLAGLTEKKARVSDKLLIALPHRNDSRWTDPKWKKQHSIITKKTMKTKDWKERHQVGVAKRTADPSWNKANAEAKMKPIITPFGMFKSLDDATTFIHNKKLLPTRTTLVSVKSYIRSKVKVLNKEYYYISKEEYIMLTGREI